MNSLPNRANGWKRSHNNFRGNNYGHCRCSYRASYSRTDHYVNFCKVNGKQSADVSIKVVFIRARGYKTFIMFNSTEYEGATCIKRLFWPPMRPKNKSCFSLVSSY